MREACHGKVRHPSQEMADAHVSMLRDRRDEPASRRKLLMSYRCRLCPYWHVGHARPWKKA